MLACCSSRRWSMGLVVWVAVAGGVPAALAGPMPMPLVCRLDLADRVVVGQIADMVETTPPVSAQGLHWGRASISVRQTLKGVAAEKVVARVVSRVDREYGGSQRRQEHRKGDDGIWLLGESNSGVEMRPLGELAEVTAGLEVLRKREWTQPVNGLRVWASLAREHQKERPVIIFAVQNNSDRPILCPSEANHGILTAMAVDAAGKDHPCDLYRCRAPAPKPEPGLFTTKLAPGQVMYLYGCYSCIDLDGQLDPGAYTVTITLMNDRRDEIIESANPPVKTWRGTLTSGPVKLTIPRQTTPPRGDRAGLPQKQEDLSTRGENK